MASSLDPTQSCLDETAVALLLQSGQSGQDAGAPPSGADPMAHVADCESCRALIAAALSSDVESADAHERADSPLRFGRYRVEGVIGAGAMGVVYRATDPELNRPVALKVLVAFDAGRAEVNRTLLLEEARAMAALSHRNVVSVYDVGLAREHAFLAMEHVDGSTLSDWLKVRERSAREVLQVFREAGEGLAAAHDAGLIHRDFKPGNVLVGMDGRVRVSDFGFAMLAGTTDRGVAGTPAYMAPEQRSGSSVDARVDQYAFCVALYEALSGERPPPNVEAISPRVPRNIRSTLARGLATDPSLRFPSMRALLAALGPSDMRRQMHAIWAVLAVLAVGVVVLASVLVAAPHRRERVVGMDGDGIPVESRRACHPGPGLGCGPGLVCRYDLGNECDRHGLGGTCWTQPAHCPEDAPAACGCDGRSYPSKCEALRHGTGIVRIGSCP